jgi:hypothetical protein
MRLHGWILTAALFAAPAAHAFQDAPPAGSDVPDVVQRITPRELGGHMRFLASDLMRGRDTATHETEIAAEYLAGHLAGAGAEPGGDVVDGKPTFFAAFPLEYMTASSEGTTLSFNVEGDGGPKEHTAKVNDEFAMMPLGVAPGEVEGPVVFAGYGVVDEQAMRDDYADLDVKDKVVVILDGQPPKEGESDRGRDNDLGAAFARRADAQNRGALAVIVVHRPGRKAPAFDQSLRFSRRMFDRPTLVRGEPPKAIPLLFAEDGLRDWLLDAAGFKSDELRPRDLPGVQARFRFDAKTETKHERNVIGFFPGSDPEKCKEVVIYSAHYDHVGVNNDEIYNGSDDNASGTSALLEIAEAFGEGPKPARSVAFLWVSGEEKGLLGSAYFSDHVTLPEGYTIIADINLDMVSRNDPAQVGLVPSPSHSDHSTLTADAAEACQTEGLTPRYDLDEYFGRTDSFHFARKGIPVIFFFSDVHEDYHRPTDDVEKADFDKAARIARAAYRLGWRVAQAEGRPRKVSAKAEAEGEH